jgi:hypothetical protein
VTPLGLFSWIVACGAGIAASVFLGALAVIATTKAADKWL